MNAPARDVVLADVLSSLEQVWEMLSQLLRGMTPAEYLWEPAPGCWTCHADRGGSAAVDHVAESAPEPDPAPITTIAWREWHIAVGCLDSYSERLFEGVGTGLEGAAWTMDVTTAGDLRERAWGRFRNGLAAAGSDWL